MCFERFLFLAIQNDFCDTFFKQLCNGVHGAAHKMESMLFCGSWNPLVKGLSSDWFTVQHEKGGVEDKRGPSTSLSQLGAPDLSAFCAQTQTWVMGLRVWEMGKV